MRRIRNKSKLEKVCLIYAPIAYGTGMMLMLGYEITRVQVLAFFLMFTGMVAMWSGSSWIDEYRTYRRRKAEDLRLHEEELRDSMPPRAMMSAETYDKLQRMIKTAVAEKKKQDRKFRLRR